MVVMILSANILAAALTAPVIAGVLDSSSESKPVVIDPPVVPCDGDPVPGGPGGGGND